MGKSVKLRPGHRQNKKHPLDSQDAHPYSPPASDGPPLNSNETPNLIKKQAVRNVVNGPAGNGEAGPTVQGARPLRGGGGKLRPNMSQGRTVKGKINKSRMLKNAMTGKVGP